MPVEVRRVYEEPGPGIRALVDRLWPRGIAKARAPFDTWCKDVAPSPELRTWYGHQPERFDEFARRYRAELGNSPGREALDELGQLARRGQLTLVTATRDVEHSGAAVLVKLLSGDRRDSVNRSKKDISGGSATFRT